MPQLAVTSIDEMNGRMEGEISEHGGMSCSFNIKGDLGRDNMILFERNGMGMTMKTNDVCHLCGEIGCHGVTDMACCASYGDHLSNWSDAIGRYWRNRYLASFQRVNERFPNVWTSFDEYFNSALDYESVITNVNCHLGMLPIEQFRSRLDCHNGSDSQ